MKNTLNINQAWRRFCRENNLEALGSASLVTIDDGDLNLFVNFASSRIMFCGHGMRLETVPMICWNICGVCNKNDQNCIDCCEPYQELPWTWLTDASKRTIWFRDCGDISGLGKRSVSPYYDEKETIESFEIYLIAIAEFAEKFRAECQLKMTKVAPFADFLTAERYPDLFLAPIENKDDLGFECRSREKFYKIDEFYTFI